MFAYILLVRGTNMQDKKYKKYMKKNPFLSLHTIICTCFFIYSIRVKCICTNQKVFSFHLGFTSIDVREGRGLMTANACEENMSC